MKTQRNLPVCEQTITSFPANSSGTAHRCEALGRTNPSRSKASKSASSNLAAFQDSPNSSKGGRGLTSLLLFSSHPYENDEPLMVNFVSLQRLSSPNRFEKEKVFETTNQFQSVSLPVHPRTPALPLVFSVTSRLCQANEAWIDLLSEALSAMWQSPQHQATLAAEEGKSPLES